MFPSLDFPVFGNATLDAMRPSCTAFWKYSRQKNRMHDTSFAGSPVCHSIGCKLSKWNTGSMLECVHPRCKCSNRAKKRRENKKADVRYRRQAFGVDYLLFAFFLF